MKVYSNPRISAVFNNWPSGRLERVTATFSLETDQKRGERMVRVTTGAPKKLTYARKMRIVDGDDGKIYIATLSAKYNHITIVQSNMQYDEETIDTDNPRYAAVLALFEAQS
jgi:hypothetical protein